MVSDALTGATSTVREAAVGAGRVVWNAIRIFVDDQALTWAGAIGLYLFLSVPPLIVATSYIGGLVAPPEAVEGFVIEQVAKYLPAEEQLLEGIVARRPEGPVAGALSTLLLLVSASRAFAAMTSAINVLWRRVDALTFWRRQALRVGMMVVTFVLLGAAALGEMAAGAVAGAVTGNDANEFWLLDWQIIPSVLLGAFLLVTYRVLPREPVPWFHAAIGAAAATVGIRLAQALLGIVGEREILATPYGHLAGVALMATWALVVGVVVLFGAALVAALDGKRPFEGEAERRFSRGT